MALSLASFLISCADWPVFTNTFGSIDKDNLRVIGVVIGPRPEVSPGDTVTATAYFGGNEVASISDFALNYRYVWGTDKAAFIDNDPITLQSNPSGFPDSARFSFRIRPDVFKGRQPFDGMPQSIVDSVCELFMANAGSVENLVSSMSDAQKAGLRKLIEKMTMPVRLMFTAHCANGTSLSIAATFTINYKSILSGITPPNNNPTISWIGICKKPKYFGAGYDYLNPANLGNGTMSYLYNTNNPGLCDSVIDIDTGYSYSLVADKGISVTKDSAGNVRIDTAAEAILDSNGNRIFETVRYQWFYQNNGSRPGCDGAELVDGDASPSIRMIPPDDTTIKAFRFWVVAFDQIDDHPKRPRGMCVRTISGIFRFSPEYIKAMEDR